MGEKPSTNKLEKFVNSEVEELSPLLQKSNELKASADGIIVNSKDNYAAAKLKRRELSAHRTSVKDMRLTFTRKLDDLKGLFMQKEDEVLAPVLQAESDLKARILEYEEKQRKIKEAEEKRISDIIAKLTVEKFDRKTVTRDEVVRAEAALKMEAGLLEKKDRNKKVIKEHIAEQREYLKELREFVEERDRQVAEAKRIEEEQQKIADDRANLDADKAKFENSKATKKDVEKDLSTPPTDPAEAAKNVEAIVGGEATEHFSQLLHDLGQEAFDEADRVVRAKIDSITGMELTVDQYVVFRAEMIDEVYSVIQKHQ